MNDLNICLSENGPTRSAVEAVEDDDLFEEDSRTKILELYCFRSDDSKDSNCFTSDYLLILL